jgi:hypothetical protein
MFRLTTIVSTRPILTELTKMSSKVWSIYRDDEGATLCGDMAELERK